MRSYIVIFTFVLLSLAGCNTKTDKETPAQGHLSIAIDHTVFGNKLVTDQFVYKNEAGNTYMISEIQWFISDIQLHKNDGTTFPIEPEDGIYYIDTDIPSSLKINLATKIPEGNYTGLSFTFGINESKNKSLRFVNPPESFMFWPDYLGGGYHYMKLNGKWMNPSEVAEPFNFHIGIGQIYDSTALKSNYVDMDACCPSSHCEGYKPPRKTMPVIGFIQNYFDVKFDQDITIYKEKTSEITLEMKIEKWFNGAHIYDHNKWGGSIMQQQPAMQQACDNGRNVFELKQQGQ